MTLHFDFSSEQRMLAESLRRLLTDGAGGDLGEIAAALSQHGLFGVMLDADCGGLGLGLTDALALSIETGRAGLSYPAVETMLAVPLMARLRPDALADVLAGKQIATLAGSGRATMVRERGRTRLTGEALAPFATQARFLAIVAGEGRATVIDLSERGAAVEPIEPFDPAVPLGRVRFDLDADADSVVADDLAVKAAILACGEMTGAAEICLERSVRHLRERMQFDRPLGANQVLRHSVADDWLAVQGMQAASEYAAAAYDSDAANAAQSAAIAKAYVSRAARKVAESAIHIHGGMGFTWDAGLHLPLRRILRLAACHGAANQHLDSLADALFAHKTHKDDRTCNSNNIASM
jgi:alkylation response protein AidB-like acyl-CoA dehydrogenase